MAIVVKASSGNGRTFAEIIERGAGIGRRVRIDVDDILETAMLLIEAHAAIRNLTAPDPLGDCAAIKPSTSAARHDASPRAALGQEQAS